MIIKCKICGGDIQFQPGDTCGQCVYCGCASTIPKTDDEQRLNRFDRANHFRRQCEFDKAIAAYERILEEDNTDAEAHWGIALSRYGIEYVEDPKTEKRVPTCHRAQVESILADADYLDAMKYAPDQESREIYESQAKEIAEIQKEILAISANEDPYDVFICYKESDENGKRTHDSALAQEVYYGLTNLGYKVFFSRITLEDKLGQHYEPYIFAALNSAKVMVVIGTKAENFNAVWVKNEWSRYLHLMKNDRKRLMIPCYRDMDPYDLPEELGNLQSQDMSKIGFLQDLLRGIRKVLDVEQNNASAAKQAGHLDAQQVDSLLDRAFINIEDGEFAKADTFLEKVLNQDPRNGRAYLGKLLVERKARNTRDLAKGTIVLDKSVAYQRAVRFADNEQRKQLESINLAIQHISSFDQKVRVREKAISDLKQALTIGQCKEIRNELLPIEQFEGVAEVIKDCDERIEQIYSANYEQAMKLFNEKSYVQARDAFEYIGDYKDSWTMALECMYQYALDEMKKGNYTTAANQFQKLGDYKDSVQYEQKCQMKAKLTRKNKYAPEPVSYQTVGPSANPTQYDRQRKRNEKVSLKKRRKNITIRVVLIILLLAAVVVAFVTYGLPTIKYNKAVGNLKAGKYVDALHSFEELGDFNGANQKIQECIVAAHKDRILHFTVIGNKVYFGTYEQNNVVDTSYEGITWLVLDVKEGKSLLLSEKGLDAKQYNLTDNEITWENSYIRNWLNGEFFTTAFSKKEQSIIVKATIDNGANQGYPSWNTNGGNNTEDRVFLLSYKEANKYLNVSIDDTENNKSRVYATEYALSQGAHRKSLPIIGGSGTSWWWLRSPGSNQSRAAYVRDNGVLGDTHLADNGCVVRPAIWLDLEADYFYPIPKNYGK